MWVWGYFSFMGDGFKFLLWGQAGTVWLGMKLTTKHKEYGLIGSGLDNPRRARGLAITILEWRAGWELQEGHGLLNAGCGEGRLSCKSQVVTDIIVGSTCECYVPGDVVTCSSRAVGRAAQGLPLAQLWPSGSVYVHRLQGLRSSSWILTHFTQNKLENRKQWLWERNDV